MSSIIKSPFVSLLNQKKPIEVVNINNSKIINSSPKEEQETKVKESESNLNQELTKTSREQDLKINYEEVIAKANKEANAIVQEAERKMAEIEVQIRTNAKAEGYKVGYEEGKIAASKELEELKVELQNAIEQKQNEKQNLLVNIEPQIASIINQLVTNLVGIQSVNPETILYLIKQGFNEIEQHGDLIIRVSSDDFDQVVENKSILSDNLSEKIDLEILKDVSLKKNDCIIETDLGNIDCSLDVRLNGLKKELDLIGKSFGKC